MSLGGLFCVASLGVGFLVSSLTCEFGFEITSWCLVCGMDVVTLGFSVLDGCGFDWLRYVREGCFC